MAPVDILRVRKFHIQQTRNAVVVILGKRGSGKTTLVLDYLAHTVGPSLPAGCRNPPYGMVLATPDQVPVYQGVFPPEMIRDGVTEGFLESFSKWMRSRQYAGVDVTGASCKRAFVVIDGFDPNADERVGELARQLFMRGRRCGVTLILTLNYPMGIPPSLRGNIDYVFICGENDISNQRKVYETYAGVFPTFELYLDAATRCTRNHNCLVLDKITNSYRLEDVVYWYKAETQRIAIDNPIAITTELDTVWVGAPGVLPPNSNPPREGFTPLQAPPEPNWRYLRQERPVAVPIGTPSPVMIGEEGPMLNQPSPDGEVVPPITGEGGNPTPSSDKLEVPSPIISELEILATDPPSKDEPRVPADILDNGILTDGGDTRGRYATEQTVQGSSGAHTGRTYSWWDLFRSWGA